MISSTSSKSKLPYNHNRPNLAIEVKRKARLERKKRILKYISAFLAVCAFLYIAFNSLWGSWFTINDVNMVLLDEKNINVVTSENIKKDVQSFLQNKLFFIIPQNKLFTYPFNKVSEQIIKKYIDIKDVKIETEGMHSIKVQLYARQPIAYICSNEIVEVKASACRYLDSDGLVFISAQSLPQRDLHDFFEIDIPGTTTAHIIGNRPIYEHDIKVLSEIGIMLKKFGIGVNKLKSLGFEGYDLIASQGVKKSGKVLALAKGANLEDEDLTQDEDKKNGFVTISVSKGENLEVSRDNLYTFLSNHKRDPEKKNLNYLTINARYNPTVYYTTQ